MNTSLNEMPAGSTQPEPTTSTCPQEMPIGSTNAHDGPTASKPSEQSIGSDDLYPSISSYNPLEKDFNFRHGHGVRNPGTNLSDNQFHEKAVHISNSGLDACINHLNNVNQDDCHGMGPSTKHLLDMYPEISPDFEDPRMAIPANDPEPITTLLSLQLILMACGAFSSGMSDTQLSFQLGFLSQFLMSCGAFGFASQQLASQFPGTLYKFKQWLGIGDIQSRFTRKVVCPKPSCCKLYDFSDCFTEDRHGNRYTKTCRAETIKNRKTYYCEEPLLQYDHSGLGNRVLKPRKEFIMRSIADQIEEKLKRKGLEEACQRWKKDRCPINVRKDIHTGNAWKMLQHQHNFFSTDHEFALQYNIDWWQPHENSNKSLGVMYFALCNLPREIRYKRENLIIGGIIPSLDYSDGNTMQTEPESLDTFQVIY